MGLKAKIAYTNTTYEQLRDALIRRIPNITDRWTDYNESDIGMTLLELFVGVATFLNYMIDRRVNELFLPNMREKKHGLTFAKSVGFRFFGTVAARTILRFSLNTPAGNNVVISKYTRCRAIQTSPIYVTTMDDALIPAGQTYVDVEAWQGIPIGPLSFDPIMDLPPYVIAENNVADRSVEVLVDGVVWTEVDTFIGYGPDHKVYKTTILEDGSTMVEFGDGFEGKIPDAQVDLFYILTDGPDGNRGSGTVVRIEDQILDSGGNSISISVTNTSELSGGASAETLYHAKKHIPAWVQTNGRGITKLDILGLVEGFPGIKQAQLLTIEEYDLFSFEIDYYQIRLAVIPENDGLPGQALKDAVRNFLHTQKKYLTADIEVVDPDYIIVDVSIEVVKFRAWSDPHVIEVVTEAIQEFFKIAESPTFEYRLVGDIDGIVFSQNVEFEQLVTDVVNLEEISTLDSLIMTADGVDYGTGQPLSDVPIGNKQIAFLGDISILVSGEI